MKKNIILPLLIFSVLTAKSQGMDLLDDEEEVPTTNYISATFKTNRVVNGHSIETVAKREFDFKISHRFGFLSTGAYELFGLDQANIRIGGDYGITDNINVGFGRSTFGKTFDGFTKYKFLKQSSGVKKMPISAVWVSHIAVTSLKWSQPLRENKFSDRVSYVHQLLVARKFSEGLSIQLSPTLVHKNLVDSANRNNDIISIGVGLRQKITSRTTINLEYYYVPTGQLESSKTNALSIGFDIETGGHVFQFFLTNATAPFEKGFITDTQAKWLDGDIRFGFNIARVFNF
ncbi:MAG: hypothetical protein COA58_12810 [Bacteroidetes bacterium]|nr:MAG: hypothetical protein COA58_12810 [Bacteroidota bacterium]